jgi:hypothetical protein
MMENIYIVTLKKFDDLQEFYEDMETPGGNLYIPNRKVECNLRRNISRNTQYLLTEEEADILRNDPRVLSVERLPKDIGLEITPYWTQTGVFEKDSNIDSNDKNWGLSRIIDGGQTAGWGTNALFTQKSGTLKTTSSGKNVDVVVVDAHINPLHPEFSINQDGTGGSRVNQIDWFQYSVVLGIPTTLTYDYGVISSNHGTHVAGTLAGNTQGWARDSNIYNIEFNYVGSNFTGTWDLVIFDYIRHWHKNKPINPITGRRNPTIVNNSWGYSLSQNYELADILQVMYRSTITGLSGLSNPIKKQALEENGVPVPFDTSLYKIPARYTALDADVEDAINDGIIMVGSSGNSYWKCATASVQDWDNFIVIAGGQQIFHSRGSSPAAAGNSICVGSIGTLSQEYKSTFSNYGPRVDIYAPGSNIVSSVYDAAAAAEFEITLANDPRNSQYKIGSISGTSMSSPQVSGLLACLAEQLPNINQTIARDYIFSKSKLGQISSTAGLAGDYTSLGDNSNNRYAYYEQDRPESGMSQPKYNYSLRTSSSMRYPRVPIQRRKVS